MGDKQDKKNILDMIDEAIMANEKRQGYLKAKLTFESDEKSRELIKQELTTLDQQLGFSIDAKKNAEIELKKAKTEEERKRIENLLKASYFIGTMRENIRMNMIYDRKLDKDVEVVQSAQYERAVDKIFNTMELRYVTKDMVEEIANDKEFAEMEAEDPNRLERKDIDMQDAYEKAIDTVLRRSDKEDLNASFESKQRRMSVLVNEKNGFLDASNEVLEMMNSDYYKKFATEEDRRFFDSIYNEMVEIGNETKKIYKEFEKHKSDFYKGNGFTRVLIEKEQEVIKKLRDYGRDKILPRVTGLLIENNEGDAEQVNKMYSASLHFIDPLVIQSGLDKVLCETNELRMRMEMWKVYERLPKGTSVSKKQIQKAVDDEYKTWSKIDRVRRSGADAGGMEKNISEWAAESALDAFKKAKDVRDSERDKNIKAANKLKFTPKQKQEIKVNIAALVLKCIMDIEAKRKVGEEKPYTKDMQEYRQLLSARNYEDSFKEHFMSLARSLADNPEFTKAYEKQMSGKDFSTKVISFIADDMDQKMAKELAKKSLTDLKNYVPKQEAKKKDPVKELRVPIANPQ